MPQETDNSIPRSVLEAANLAEELHAKMFTPQSEPTDKLDTIEEDVASNPTEPEVIDLPEEDEPVPANDLKELRKFRDRYLSLKGKYDAEVPRLAADVRELREKLANVSKEAPTASVEQENEEDYISTVNAEYGEDFINAIRKVIQHEVKPIVQPVQDKVQSVQNTQVDVATENFKAHLDTQVKNGDWRALVDGEDSKFIEFLSKPDPSGLYTYGDLFNLYNENWEADKLAKVFDTYLESTKPKNTTNKQAANQQQEALIAPNRTNTQTTPNTDQKRIWTLDSFEEFQRNDRAGKYSTEESQRMWDDVMSAPAEGRMR